MQSVIELVVDPSCELWSVGSVIESVVDPSCELQSVGSVFESVVEMMVEARGGLEGRRA